MNYRKHVGDIVDAHSRKAQQSFYDRDVNIMAVVSVREKLMTIPVSIDGEEYLRAVLRSLDELSTSYNDTDGEYTCGRGMIVGVRDDVHMLLRQCTD